MTSQSQEDTTPIFPPSLLTSPSPSSALSPLTPKGYTLRPLQRGDYARGYFECLSTLTWVGDGDVGVEAKEGARGGGADAGGKVAEADGKEEGKEVDGRKFEKRFLEQFDWMRSKGEGWWYNVVIEFEEMVVGTGVLVVERKFIHDFGTIGHIEDISISKERQGKGLGKLLIAALDAVAKEVGCYKSILDCSAENAGFYEKCGYEKSGQEMSQYFEDGRSEYMRG